MHLAQMYDSGRAFFATDDANSRSSVVQWLFWVNAGLGPMAGQLSHFNYYAPQIAPDAGPRAPQAPPRC